MYNADFENTLSYLNMNKVWQVEEGSLKRRNLSHMSVIFLTGKMRIVYMVVWELNELIHVKHLEKSLTYSKHSEILTIIWF